MKDMKKIFSLLLCAQMCGTISADKLPVKQIKWAGPYTTQAAIKMDEKDVYGKDFDENAGLRDGISPMLLKQSQLTQESDSLFTFTGVEKKSSVYLAGFHFENTHYAQCNIKVTGKQQHFVYVDGKMGGQQNLMPGRHEVVVKVMCRPGESDTLSLALDTKQSDFVTINPEGKRLYTLSDYMNGEKASTTSLSADGRYLLINASTTRNDGKAEWRKEIVDLKTGAKLSADGFKQWCSTGSLYIASSRGVQQETIYYKVNPATGERTPFFTDYTNSYGSLLPGEKEMLVSKSTEGPREDKDVHQVLEPDDRQPGWRNRTNIQLLNVENGQLTTLTQGQKNTYASVSPDGTKVLLMVNENDITERPFTFMSVLLYDRETEKIDTLVRRDGFLSQCSFSPDGKYIVLQGSPEALGGIGKNDPTGKTPSMIQQELFLMNLETKQVESITFDFNPNISKWAWSKADGNIYAIGENRDRQDIFRINPFKKTAQQLKLTECYIKSFSLAEDKPMLSYTGQSDSNADRVYVVDLKSGKETLVHDWNVERMGDIVLGPCQDWNFLSSRGDTIYGRYYLPPHFDANKKYPMLVYYYGGCSPTGRYLESYYNFHGWAAMGYVVYVVQPSGCTGFGQEFAARHVNTYGEGTADDIIEGTKKFCQEHPYVNDKKIGCLGASYGGFMTQYLMTVTDIFAASMSHAGISNPTSYWGYGYWGYSYSATSAADSYPWNNEKLLSGQAPLFRADKVHTPILFLHGASDTNVPINESIQMFTALKILGRECAFVTVEGQDHHITDYEKQKKWVSTYYAWFAKYLQDDDTWWEALYPTKNLR